MTSRESILPVAESAAEGEMISRDAWLQKTGKPVPTPGDDT